MKIFVNGTQHDWPKETADYLDIVRLAKDSRDPSMGWSVTYYWRGEGDGQRSGILHLHKAPIKVADGMVFDAAITGNA